MSRCQNISQIRFGIIVGVEGIIVFDAPGTWPSTREPEIEYPTIEELVFTCDEDSIILDERMIMNVTRSECYHTSA